MGAHGMTIALPTHHHNDNSDSTTTASSSSGSSSTSAQALLTISALSTTPPALGVTHKDKGSTPPSQSFNGTLLSLRAPTTAAKSGGVLVEGMVGDVTVFQVTNTYTSSMHNIPRLTL